MEKFALDIFKMRDPERLFAIALLLSPHTDREGRFREPPLKILQRIFSPHRPTDSGRASRLIFLLREVGYLENKNPKGHPGIWVLHLPPGAQSLAGHELAVQAEVITDVTRLVQRWGPEKIPAMISVLEALKNREG